MNPMHDSSGDDKDDDALANSQPGENDPVSREPGSRPDETDAARIPPDDAQARPVTEREKKRRHENAVIAAAKAAGRTDEQAAELAGLSDRTIRRRRAEDPEFVENVARARDRRVSELTERLIGLAERAAIVLSEVLDDDDVRMRLRATDLSLRETYRFHNGDVNDRLDKLTARFDKYIEQNKPQTKGGDHKKGDR